MTVGALEQKMTTARRTVSAGTGSKLENVAQTLTVKLVKFAMKIRYVLCYLENV